MDSIKICAIALIAVFLSVTVRQLSANFALPLRAATAVAFASLLLLAAQPTVEYLDSLFNITGFSKYATVILKGLGVALLTNGCACVCRDCGEGTVAGCVELAGKLEIFVLCIPLINELLAGAKALLEW